MTHRWKKATYTTIAGLGLFTGAAGIAGAATGNSNPPASAAPANQDCVDGLDAASGVECDGGPAANAANDPTEAGEREGTEAGETFEDQPAYTSSITVAETGHGGDDATEAAALTKLATVTADQASRAAIATVPGTVIKVELDNENGSVVYSVEIRTDAGVVEVKVDAGNGKVLAQEADRAEHGGRDAADDATGVNGRDQDD
jgi:uncharacterized membrane protein YkoI